MGTRADESNGQVNPSNACPFKTDWSSVNERSHDEAFVHLLRRGFDEWESLSSVEQAQMHLNWNDYISILHRGFRLYERGVLDEGS